MIFALQLKHEHCTGVTILHRSLQDYYSLAGASCHNEATLRFGGARIPPDTEEERMRIGLFMGTHRVPWDLARQVEDIASAEREGFDSYWCAQVGQADVLTLLALAGGKTGRIELGTSVVQTYPRHPNVMAQQALTVNAATNGRLTLGIGPSHRPAIEALGLSYDRAALHMREYLSVLRPLVYEGRVRFQGEMYRIQTGMQVPGARPFPILISALAPLMLKVAGELADGTITWMVGNRTLESHTVPRIRRAAEAAGRPAPRVVAGVPVALHANVDEARERASLVFQGYGDLVNYRRQMDLEGVSGPEGLAIVGVEQDVERGLRAYAAAGATDFIASPFGVGEDRVASLLRTRAFLSTLVGKV